ncbi:MAG: hypothetical protein IJM25_04275 [Eubacterium sp.]|nr:hypothetical protein [Eubacterium sp.]
MEKADFLFKENVMDFGSDLQRSIYVGSCIPSEEELEKASPEKQLLYPEYTENMILLYCMRRFMPLQQRETPCRC